MSDLPFVPTRGLAELRVGDISLDRAVTVGLSEMLFLYQGSNRHYDSYSRFAESVSIECGRQWSNLTAERHSKHSSVTQMISLFVPNPASCLPDLYPLPLHACPTPAWSEMRRLLVDDDGVLFCDELFEASLPEQRHSAAPWIPVDSHWSEFGSLLVANALLRRLAVSPIEADRAEVLPRFTAGDLGSRFGEEVGVFVQRELRFDLPSPECVYDSGNGSMDGASMGRRIEWHCAAAPMNASLVVIGNSFAGTGLQRLHLVFWLSRVFRRTVFLHGSSIPTDILDVYRPDIILFQGLERFLGVVPVDVWSAEQCEAIYEKPPS